MLIINIPKEYLTDENGVLSCTKCRQCFPLLSKECSKNFYGCLIKGELVQCEKCEYWDAYTDNGKPNGMGHCKHPNILMSTSENFFCGFGKRKDGEE